MAMDVSELTPTLKEYEGKKGILIPLLQQIQGRYGYVPREAVDLIAREFAIPPVDIYGVLTFYAQFYLTPRGKYTVRVCQGTACYIMGGKEILHHVKGSLKVSVDETTDDGLFTLETVACLGCCGLAPVVAIGEKLHGKSTIGKATELVEQCRHSQEAE